MKARRVLGWTGIVLLGLPVLLLLLLATPPMTRFVVRKALPSLNKQLNGQLAVEGIGGSLLTKVELRGVTLRDPEGEIVLQAQRVNVGYSLWDLLHSKISLNNIVLERPIVRLLKDHPGEQYSLLRVFAQENAPAKRDTSTIDLTIKQLDLHDGSIIATVWRTPADPQRENAQQLDTVQLIGVNLGMPLIHYSSGPGVPSVALAQIGSASGHLVDPELELYELAGEAQMRGDSIAVALQTIKLPHSRLSADAWLVTAAERRRFDASADIAELRMGDVSGFIAGADIPDEWSVRGNIRARSQRAGDVMVSSPDLELVAAGGTVRGHVTVIGSDNEWRAQNSRLNVQGVKVERLLRAFHVPSNLRAQIAGVITADGKSGTVDLRLAGAGGYGVRGPLHGHLRASGQFQALTLETELAGGGMGSIWLAGDAYPGAHLKLSNVRGRVRSFNLAAVDARMPESSLNGEFEGGVAFGSMPREGSLRLFLDSSMVRGVQIDTVLTVAHVESGRLTAESILVRAPGLRMTGAGTFGLLEDQTGDITLTLDAPSLSEVGPVVGAFTRDSLPGLAGALQLVVTARGSLESYTLGLEARGREIAIKGLQADSIHATAAGRPDSLSFEATAAVDSVTTVSVGGRRDGQTVHLDSLTIARGEATWSLDDSARIEMQGGTFSFENAVLRRSPESGVVTINGAYPGDITLVAQRVPLVDFLPNAKDVDSLPFLDANATYSKGVATGSLALLTNSGAKPLTAEFATKPTIRGRLTADSFDLSLVAPLVPSVKKLGGRLDGTVAVQGGATGELPKLDGKLSLSAARATVPATGVHYHDLQGELTFVGDVLELHGVQVLAGKGRADLSGGVRFARLDRPELNVALKTERFPVMNRRDFLEATATGDLWLRGSPSGATLTGSASLDDGTAYLEKFLRSSGINLSDPLYAQFVDTTVLHEATEEPGLVEALMDSLRIDSMSVNLGDHFWLRSPDASIQLAGRLTVSSAGSTARGATSGDKYHLVGTVRAVRGNYRMALAPGLTREFTIREGSIRYFGTPKSDAILDLAAEHVVRTATGDKVTITVRIGGSLEKPTLALTSDVAPPLSETEIISYLVFGAPTAQAFLGREGQTGEHHSVFEKSAQQIAGVLSGKIESAVVSQLGLPIDYFRIKPGEVQSGLAGTELVLGMQVRILGYPSYLRASPRFCPREQLLSLDHIGIELETRFTHQWGIATAVDPVQGCEAAMSSTAARPYQFGFDLFWEKR